jgi:hypothetical protein
MLPKDKRNINMSTPCLLQDFIKILHVITGSKLLQVVTQLLCNFPTHKIFRWGENMARER